MEHVRPDREAGLDQLGKPRHRAFKEGDPRQPPAVPSRSTKSSADGATASPSPPPHGWSPADEFLKFNPEEGAFTLVRFTKKASSFLYI